MQISQSGRRSFFGWGRVSRWVGIGVVAAIRQRLGEPWLASEYWRFDLFRLTGEDVRGYVLVYYDESGHASAYGKGVTHGENLSWRTPMEGEDSILLIAGEVRFAVETSSHTPSVLISAARRDEYPGTPPPGATGSRRCTEPSMCQSRCPRRFASSRC